MHAENKAGYIGFALTGVLMEASPVRFHASGSLRTARVNALQAGATTSRSSLAIT